MARLITAGGGAEPGTIQAFARATPPRGWLKANGELHNIADQPRLFAALGTTYGGDGITTFGVPDLRGEFVRGWDDGRSKDAGRALGSHQADEIKSHGHSGSTNSAGSHSHRAGSRVGKATGDSRIQIRLDTNTGVTASNTTSAGNHSHSVTVNNTGGVETRPTNVAMLYCIKR